MNKLVFRSILAFIFATPLGAEEPKELKTLRGKFQEALQRATGPRDRESARSHYMADLARLWDELADEKKQVGGERRHGQICEARHGD